MQPREELEQLEELRVQAVRTVNKLSLIRDRVESSLVELGQVETNPAHRQRLFDALVTAFSMLDEELHQAKEHLSDVELDKEIARKRSRGGGDLTSIKELRDRLEVQREEENAPTD